MSMTADELYLMFRRNFPSVIRSEETVRKIVSDPELTVFEERIDGSVVGVLLLKENCVKLLCVEKQYRNRGIGGRLLSMAENAARENGYEQITVGVGKGDYITPGVPTGRMVYDETLHGEKIYPDVTDEAAVFFEKHGYFHNENNANIFDMCLNWSDYHETDKRIGNIYDGILYRFADIGDIDGIAAVTDDAEEGFTKYYRCPHMYTGERNRVLCAVHGDEIVGVLMVEKESEERGMGSVGCTAVKRAWQGKKIAATMVLLGTGYLRECGMNGACLGYTYSGLDKLYGASGYRITVYYYMACKKLM